MRSRSRIAFVVGFAALAASLSFVVPQARAEWHRPPRNVLDVLHAPDFPGVILSPTGQTMALVRPLRYPPLADLAQPMYRLAGVRVNPKNNGIHNDNSYTEVVLKQVNDGRETKLALPADARVVRFHWSADGRRFALVNRADSAIELWTGDAATGAIRRVPNLALNPVLGGSVAWMPDQASLLVRQIAPDRGPMPEKPLIPAGPRVREGSGLGASSTYEARDVLTGPYDEALFGWFIQSRLALVDVASGKVTPIGRSAMIADFSPAPDGRFFLVETLQKPWSYAHTWDRFAKNVEVWDRDGQVVYALARLPLADQVPIQGVPEGPRDYRWIPTEPATLLWIEALDGGNPANKAEQRDRLVTRQVPPRLAMTELYRAPHRITGVSCGERDGLLLVTEYERERRWRHVTALTADGSKPPRPLWDQSVNDRYADPGAPVMRVRPDGGSVLWQEGDNIYMTGDGASPAGDRPFLDRVSLTTLQHERLFRSDADHYERFIGWIDAGAGAFLARRESPTEPPNLLVRTLGARLDPAPAAGEALYAGTTWPVTNDADPTPELRRVQKKLVTYQRADGTPLAFTLYLPPGYREGTRLPTILYAYPLEYSDPATAGQVSGSDRQFTRLSGPSPLFLALSGYAVLWNTTMPVIGDPETAYDTFVEQLVADAQAAVDKAVDLGVADRDRVGITGHSHGGLMTATLLAHSDIFRAGVARSGAYNHTIRPFGFQSERRTLWQAPDTYVKLSPVMYAPQINEPILIVHGEIDYNPGTIPFQSEKLFEAVRGCGGTARLVMLPYESHGYASREAVEEVLADQLEWFDRYVRNAGPRTPAGAQ